MSFGKVSVSVMALALTAGAAHAQVPRGMGALAPETRNMAENGDMSSRRLENAIGALNAKNFVVAESLFEDVLRHNRTNPQANMLMGATKMSLGKWDEAKTYLETAVKKAPKDPDARGRLGVTLIKLGDVAGATAQRGELVKLQAACRKECRNGEWIDNAIAMIDGAMPPKS